jgi:uncharacterized protein YciI
MKHLFAVTRTHGPAWDGGKPMEAQEKWAEHATFMNQLAADGFIVLGGPLGQSGDVLLVIDATDANEINAALARDPWSQLGLLAIKEIQPWTILLQRLEKA